MKEFFVFAVLGLGSGAAYALLGIGVVAVFKGSGVLNFSQGAMAMFAAFCYAKLTALNIAPGLAALVTVVGSAFVGMVLFMLLVRPLRNAPLLAKAVMTIGLLLALEGLASVIWTDAGALVPSILPTSQVTVFNSSVGLDRLLALGITIAMGGLLWALYRFTTFGLATRGAAESERAIALMGFSPDVIGAANWGLGAACAALAGVIVVPIVGLDITGLSLMIVPAFAAALLGAFRSFGLTVITGVLIGIVESEVTLHTTQTGLPQAVPFVVIIVAMVITGKLIPARGTLGLERPAFAPPSRLNPVAFLAVGGGVTLALALFNPVYIAATTTSLLAAIIGLSLVLVTGFLGQISLAQMAFAGAGAFAAAKFSSSLGIPFPWPVLMASVVGGLSGLVIGLPALRIRGLNLAVVTLGLSVAVSAAVLSAPNLNGASGAGTATDAPSLWGFSLAPAAHPFRYGMLVLIVLGVMAAIVINIRRSPMGQRMLAVRSNERSAAAAGINVSAVKLQGFALSAAIASIGGALIAYQIGIATPDSFQAFSSITILVLVYIGGIACVSGALIAGLITSGGVIYTLLTGINGISNYWLLLSGVGLIITALTQPDGVAVANMRMWRTLKRKVGRELPTPAIPAPPGRLGDEVRDPTEVARS